MINILFKEGIYDERTDRDNEVYCNDVINGALTEIPGMRTIRHFTFSCGRPVWCVGLREMIRRNPIGYIIFEEL